MVDFTNLKVYKTTNNLGGAITGTQVVAATSNNLFTNVPRNEQVIGEDYYACIYWKNTHGNEKMASFKLWLSSKSFPLDTEIKWGFDPNTTAQTIADKYTSPTGVTWHGIETQNTATIYGDLNAGASFPIWIWLHVNANAQARLDDNCIFTTNLSIPQGGTGSSGGGSNTPGTYHYDPYGTMPEDVVTIEHTASLSLSNFSLASWFRTTKNYTTDLAGYLIAKGDFFGAGGNWINYSLLISADFPPFINCAEVMFENSSGTGHSAIGGQGSFGSTTPVNDGQWHLMTGTYNGTNLKLYVDAVLVDDDNEPDTPDTNTNSLIIGGHEGFFTYEGDQDEVRIWNTVLTQAEITALYTDGTVPQTGALVYENTFGGSGSGGGSGGTGGNPPPTPTDYKIAIAGDWGCEPETDDVIDLIQSQGYDYTVGVGDNAYEAAGCWTTRFTPLKPNFNSAYGNHEYSETGGTTPYKTFFGHSLTYFSFQVENVFFLIGDTNIDIDVGSNQHNFITSECARVLNDPTITWRVFINHHPWFGSGSDHPANEFNQVEALHTLLANNKFNFVCAGHNHHWVRSHQVVYNSSSPTSPTIVDSSSPYSRTTTGIIHVISGTGGHDTGGSLYSLPNSASWQAYANRTHNGVWEMVASNNGQTLTCSYVDINGDKFDTFTIS